MYFRIPENLIVRVIFSRQHIHVNRTILRVASKELLVSRNFRISLKACQLRASPSRAVFVMQMRITRES